MGPRFLPLQGSSLRPLSGSCHLHGSPTVSSPYPSLSRDPVYCVPRRLDPLGCDGGRMPLPRFSGPVSPQISGIPNQRPEIPPRTLSDHRVVRSRMGLQVGSPSTSSPGGSPHFQQGLPYSGRRLGFPTSDRVPLGFARLRRPDIAFVQAEKEDVGPDLGILARRLSDVSHTSPGSLPSTPSLVDFPRTRVRMAQHARRPRTALGLGRCLRKRLGSPPGERPLDGGRLESRRTILAHQSARNSGDSIPRRQSLGPGGVTPPRPHRQCDCLVCSEPPGFYTLSPGHGPGGYSTRPVYPEARYASCLPHSGIAQCRGRFTVPSYASPHRMGAGPQGSHGSPVLGSGVGGGPHGNSFQLRAPFVRVPLPSSSGFRGGRSPGRLDQVVSSLYLPSFVSSGFSSSEDSSFSGFGPAGGSCSPGSPSSPGSGFEGFAVQTPPPPSPTTLQGRVVRGLKSKCVSMDRISLVTGLLRSSYGEPALLLARSHRPSSVRQAEVAWRAWQSWLTNHHDSEHISVSSVLRFLIFLAEVRNLSPSTVNCYRSSLRLPLRLLADIDVTAFPFPDLTKALFLRNPRAPPLAPSWSLERVLALLQTPSFAGPGASPYNTLRHCLFLIALASGNRVSELSALVRPPQFPSGSEASVTLPVRPGFLFKNQRRGRAPPNVVITSLRGSPRSLCPVWALGRYLRGSTRPGGSLFLHSQRQTPLRPPTVSATLCSVIEEADPGRLPRAHDVRRMAASLAWTRGLAPEDIVRRAFWRSSSTFIDTYLVPVRPVAGVALNTC